MEAVCRVQHRLGISCSWYFQCVYHLVKHGCTSMFFIMNSARELRRFSLLRAHLFDLFDTHHAGSVALTELLAGLSVLCGGETNDKVCQGSGSFGWNVQIVHHSACHATTHGAFMLRLLSQRHTRKSLLISQVRTIFRTIQFMFITTRASSCVMRVSASVMRLSMCFIT